jgi:DNA segregation ATPase FtsK/SpoIIIE, S-DNA-T family
LTGPVAPRWAAAWSVDRVVQARDWFAGRRARAEREEVRKRDSDQAQDPDGSPYRAAGRADHQPSRRKPSLRQQPLFKNLTESGLPPLELLDEPPPSASGYSEDALKAMSRQVELKLADFGVEVEVVAVHPGPVITRFELQPAPGVKAHRFPTWPRTWPVA